MTEAISTRVTIEAAGSGRVTLVVDYEGGKKARVELPLGAPTFDREKREDICRRELHNLMDALYQWALESGDIVSQPPREADDAEPPRTFIRP